MDCKEDPGNELRCLTHDCSADMQCGKKECPHCCEERDQPGTIAKLCIRNARLIAALERCVKAMGTLESGVPLAVAMRDEKFREFLYAARDAKALLDQVRK